MQQHYVKPKKQCTYLNLKNTLKQCFGENLGLYRKELKAGSERDTHIHVHSSVTHDGYNVQAAPVLIHGMSECDTYMQWKIVQPLEEGNYATHSIMDKPHGHFVK